MEASGKYVKDSILIRSFKHHFVVVKIIIPMSGPKELLHTGYTVILQVSHIMRKNGKEPFLTKVKNYFEFI